MIEAITTLPSASHSGNQPAHRSMPSMWSSQSIDLQENLLKGARILSLLTSIVLAAFAGNNAFAAQTNVAVAANFIDAAKEVAAAFKQKTGHEVVLSFGSSGQLYLQITQDAPFQILLSADDIRPKQLVNAGIGVAESLFTYAIGKLVLWSKTPNLVKGAETLKMGAFSKLSIANPTAAPYGVAAVETLKALKIYEALQPKIVQGESIAQAFQFIDTGNAELGFIALSQLAGNTSGSRWLVPQELYAPIRQDAVLLKKGASNEAATGFVTFLRGAETRAIIEKYGYAVDE
jgi:molybdate transport system substrate-binding protein